MHFFDVTVLMQSTATSHTCAPAAETVLVPSGGHPATQSAPNDSSHNGESHGMVIDHATPTAKDLWLAVEVPANIPAPKHLIEVRRRLQGYPVVNVCLGESYRGIKSVLVRAGSAVMFASLKRLMPEWKAAAIPGGNQGGQPGGPRLTQSDCRLPDQQAPREAHSFDTPAWTGRLWPGGEGPLLPVQQHCC